MLRIPGRTTAARATGLDGPVHAELRTWLAHAARYGFSLYDR